MEELIPYAGPLLEAILNGQWWMAASVVVAALTLSLRLIPYPPIKTAPVQVIGSFLLAMAGGILNVLAAGAEITSDVLVTALQIGAAAGAAVGGIPALVAWWKARRKGSQLDLPLQ